MKHPQHKSVLLFLVLVLFLGLSQTVSSQLPGYLEGSMTVGDPTSLVNGDLQISPTGKLYLGSHSPRHLQTNMLSITGNYIGELGSQVFVSVTDNSNLANTRGYIDIVGTATKTDGATTIILDMFELGTGWDGSCISLIRANKTGTDVGTFRMDPMKQLNGRTAILRYREQDNDIVWYLTEQLITGQQTSAAASCVGGTLNPLTVTTAPSVSCTYQWYRCDATGSNLVSLGSADGAQTSSYQPSSAVEGTSYYRCVVGGSTCYYNTDTSAVSGAISVGSTLKSEFINGPVSQVVPQGGAENTVKIGVSVNGVAVAYQWYKDNVKLDGETGDSLTIVLPDDGSISEYYVEVTGACSVGGILNIVRSESATVGYCLPIIVQKRNHTLLVNNNIDSNGGYNFVYYTWYRNDNELKSESGGAPGTFAKGGYYYTGGASVDNLKPVDAYYAIMLDAQNRKYQTCVFHPSVLNVVQVSAYPIPVNSLVNYSVTVEAEVSNESTLSSATIDVYNAAGAFLSRTRATGRFTQVNLPHVSGVYVLVFKSSEINKEIKVIVE